MYRCHRRFIRVRRRYFAGSFNRRSRYLKSLYRRDDRLWTSIKSTTICCHSSATLASISLVYTLSLTSNNHALLARHPCSPRPRGCDCGSPRRRFQVQQRSRPVLQHSGRREWSLAHFIPLHADARPHRLRTSIRPTSSAPFWALTSAASLDLRE